MKMLLKTKIPLFVFSLTVGVLSLSSCNPNAGLNGGGVSGTWQGNAQFEARFVPGRYLIRENNGKLSGDYQNCNETFSQCQTSGTIVGNRDQNAISFVIKINNQDAAEFIGTTESTQKIMEGSIRDSDGTGTLRLDKK
jgi:hypothetical protein